MSNQRSKIGKKRVFSTVLLIPLFIIVGNFVHEVIHIALNYAVTFEMGSCGIGPFGMANGRLYACYAEEGIGAYNDLLTPLLTSMCGVGLMYYSTTTERSWLQLSTFVSGTFVWLQNAFYGMAFFNPPVVKGGEIIYYGDGIDALSTFGKIIYIPYTFILIIGFIMLINQTKFQNNND